MSIEYREIQLAVCSRQRTEVRGQGSEVRSQRSEIGKQRFSCGSGFN